MPKLKENREKTELELIREELGYNRPMFAKKVIHKALITLFKYEHGIIKIPESVMYIAKKWLKFYRKNCKNPLDSKSK